MEKCDIGRGIQEYINKKVKTKQISLKKIMMVLEKWRYEVMFNTMGLYTLCESCGRNHKINPTKIKWLSRMDKP